MFTSPLSNLDVARQTVADRRSDADRDRLAREGKQR
jgi:hypothetical protein